MLSGLLVLGNSLCEIMFSWNHVPLTRPLQAQSTSSLSSGWTWMEHVMRIWLFSSHIWTRMLDNVHEYLSFAFLLISYSCGGLLQYHIYLVLTIVIFFRLITVITGTEKRLLLACITLFWLQSGTSSTTKNTDKISRKKEYLYKDAPWKWYPKEQ
jgi:hypothetical protein